MPLDFFLFKSYLQYHVVITFTTPAVNLTFNLTFLSRLEARCAFGKFDCEARNPCTPALCEEGVENYPGSSPRRYVNCTERCAESRCPKRQVWDQEKQRCVRKNT